MALSGSIAACGVVARHFGVDSGRAKSYQSANVLPRPMRRGSGAAGGVASVLAFRGGPVGRVDNGRP